LDSGCQGSILGFVTSAATSLVPAAPKPLRADARRNRERILVAARAVFADKGSEAQIDDVAKRAKVGVGTVYRHFPTKEALVDAIVREGFDEIAGFARDALDHEDAWEGFERLIWRSAERNAEDRGFCEAIAMTDRRDLAGECGLDALTQELLDRAKTQGTVRQDASSGDVALMMCALGAVMRLDPSQAWRRYLTLMLDGLRAS
jgi:AcrR family transcriptional regulator